MATTLPPNEFIPSAAIVERPAEAPAVAFPSPQARDATAACSDSGVTDCPPGEAAASLRQSLDAAADISDIGEIFRGARKLQSAPDIFEFDPTAITTSDHLLYDVLKAMVDPRLPGLRKIPDEQALFDAIEPPPLFLQAVGY